MAERSAKGKGKGKGKIFEKPIPTKPRTRRKFKNIYSLLNKLQVIIISSSDSEEGFVEEITPSLSRHTTSPEKVSFEKVTPSSSRPTAPPKKETKQETELPQGAKLLMDCEAVDILQTIHAKLDSLKSLEIKMPKSFGSALQYSKDAVHYTDVKTVKNALEGLKRDHKATDWEICILANSCPNTREEAYALIPSLKDKKDWIDEPLKTVLNTLAIFKVVECSLDA